MPAYYVNLLADNNTRKTPVACAHNTRILTAARTIRISVYNYPIGDEESIHLRRSFAERSTATRTSLKDKLPERTTTPE
jgi:hypothetical protein